MLDDLAGQGLMDEGLAAARTEQGLAPGDALAVIAVLAFALLAIVQFLADPLARVGTDDPGRSHRAGRADRTNRYAYRQRFGRRERGITLSSRW